MQKNMQDYSCILIWILLVSDDKGDERWKGYGPEKTILLWTLRLIMCGSAYTFLQFMGEGVFCRWIFERNYERRGLLLKLLFYINETTVCRL